MSHVTASKDHLEVSYVKSDGGVLDLDSDVHLDTVINLDDGVRLVVDSSVGGVKEKHILGPVYHPMHHAEFVLYKVRTPQR